MYRIEKEPPTDSVDSLTMNKIIDLERRFVNRDRFWKSFASVIAVCCFLTIWLLSLKWDDTMGIVYKDSVRLNDTILHLEKSLTKTLSAEVKLHHLQNEIYVFMKNTSSNAYGHDKHRLDDALEFSLSEQKSFEHLNTTKDNSLDIR